MFVFNRSDQNDITHTIVKT